MKKHKIYFENLNSIRFIAAMMVFFAHTIHPGFNYLPIKNTFWERLLNLLSDGGVGVSIFFVLSGFLITYLLLDEFELNHRIHIINFYLRRILRIWPLYFAVLTFSFLIYPGLKILLGLNNPLKSDILYYLFFLSNFDVINIAKHCAGYDAASQNITWSVSVEEQFYLFWPLIFYFLPKKFWLASLLLVITGSVIFRVLHYKDTTLLYFHSLSVMLDLGIGGVFAYLVREHSKIKRFFQNCSTIHHVIFFSITFLLLLWNDLIFNFSYGVALGRIFTSIAFAFIICAQALTRYTSIFNLKNLSFADKWGKYTYGIYLIHPIVITLVNVLARITYFSENNFIALCFTTTVCLIFTLIISKLSYEYFEIRFLRLKDKLIMVKPLDKTSEYENISSLDRRRTAS